jgi:hypothetical protein
LPSAYSFGQKIGGSEVELDIDPIGAGSGKHAKIACAAERIPIDLNIHMGVHIDEAGDHEQPVGIDFTRSVTGDATDLDNPAIRYCYIDRGTGRFIAKSMENRRGTALTAPMALMANLTGHKRRSAAIDRTKPARR